MKTHIVFHVSLLEPCRESKIPGQIQAPLPCIQINGKEEFEVEEISDSKVKNYVHYFLVHWRSHDISEHTWKPLTNLTNAQDIFKDFHKKYSTKLFFVLWTNYGQIMVYVVL